MFLFVHGCGASKSLWLPQIRSLLSLDQEYSDQLLLETFTISIPGHPDTDKVFSQSQILQMLQKAIQDKGPKQMELARKLTLTHDPEILSHLQDPKATLIGHSSGAAYNLLFALKHPQWVSKIIGMGVGAGFNPVAVWGLRLVSHLASSLPVKTSQTLARKLPKLRWRILWTILTENPKQQGFKSCLDFMSDYDFPAAFKMLSLNQQLQTLKIPILLIQGRFDFINTYFSAAKLRKTLDPNTPVLQTKKTIIQSSGTQYENCRLHLVSSGHNPMDDDLVGFVYEVRQFLRTK